VAGLEGMDLASIVTCRQTKLGPDDMALRQGVTVR